MKEIKLILALFKVEEAAYRNRGLGMLSYSKASMIYADEIE
jgi:hypothetical protein